MTKKRFTFDSILPNVIKIKDGEKCLTGEDIVNCLNALHEENQLLKSENNMLRTTIGRNEAYINRLKNKGEWR